MPYLLCDFHIHTDWSDGKMTIAEVVDFFGSRGFDAIAITDHIDDIVSVQNGLSDYKLNEETFPRYLAEIKREAKRAKKAYGMIVFPGAEMTNQTNGYHIIGLDIERFVNPDLSVIKIILHIQDQDGLAIACHPGVRQADTGEMMDFSWHLREKRELYRDYFDAWEIANRYDLFNWVGTEKLPYLAGSDFHDKKHHHAWKTLLKCEKNKKAIKIAIKKNAAVGIVLL